METFGVGETCNSFNIITWFNCTCAPSYGINVHRYIHSMYFTYDALPYTVFLLMFCESCWWLFVVLCILSVACLFNIMSYLFGIHYYYLFIYLD